MRQCKRVIIDHGGAACALCFSLSLVPFERIQLGHCVRIRLMEFVECTGHSSDQTLVARKPELLGLIYRTTCKA